MANDNNHGLLRLAFKHRFQTYLTTNSSIITTEQIHTLQNGVYPPNTFISIYRRRPFSSFLSNISRRHLGRLMPIQYPSSTSTRYHRNGESRL
jgi:hypothetical protein